MVFPVKKEDAFVTEVLPPSAQKETVAPEIAKKPLFGNAISEAFYRLVQNCFFEHKLYRVLDIALWDDTTIYTFCNLWRIEKGPKGNAYFEYSLIKKTWFRMNPRNFPTLRIIPVGDLAGQLLKSVAGEVMHYFVHIGAIPKSNEVIALPDQFFIMKKVLGEHIKFVNKNGGSKILAKVLWGELIDRTVLSQYCQVKPHRTSSFLNTYLHFYEHRRGLAKVMREHPNLIPLLHRIHARHWSRKDLFATKNWVIEKEGRSAPVEKWSEYPGYFSKATFRWLMQAKRSIVRKIVKNNNMNFIENLVMSGATIPDNIFEIAITGRMPRGRAYAQLTRLLAQECKRRKKDLKPVERRVDLVAEYRDIADWLHHSGAGLGFPDKHSTWNSLLRRHEVWVRDLQYTSRNHYAWDSPLPDMEIGRFTVKPLLTSDALYEEGEKMRHCIVSYEGQCKDGHYLAFALHDTKNDRDFTLGFYTEDQKTWEFDQIRSYCNSAASKKAIDVGKVVLSLLNREEPVAGSNRV